MVRESKQTVCPYDCPDACGLLVETVDDKAVKVMGDPNHPHTRGSLCPKMVHYEETVHSSKRLLTPLLRVGPKGTGQFRPISWPEALEHIQGKWQKIIEQYGAEAILPYSYAGTMGLVQRNSGEAFFHRLGASRLERTICSSAKGYGWSTVMGGTLAIHPGEVALSDLIILWGTNALATNIHLLQQIREAKGKGATLWLIETYESPTAVLADKVILVKPGSDGALALGLIHILLREKLIDKKFIADHVQGFEDFAQQSIAEYPPEIVSDITGVPIAILEEMAKAYGQAHAPFISLGSGLSRYGNGAMSVRAITCLPAVVGAWTKPGGGLLASVGTGSAFSMDKITRPDFIKEKTRIINMNQLGNALVESNQSPPIMSLYVYHSNPAAVAPDQNAVLAGLAREDLFTIVHERFMTDTALFADLVLPATSSLEHGDLYRSYGHYVVQRAFSVIPPVGEAKANWDVFRLLAKVMGFEEGFFQQTTDEMIDLLLAEPGPWLASLDIEKIKLGKPMELPLPANYKTTYKTPSGKIEIFNPREDETLPRYIAPHDEEGAFWFMNAPGLYSLNSSFNERDDLVARSKGNYLMMNPQDAKSKQLVNEQQVIAFNKRGEVQFILEVTEKVPPGVVVAEGIMWMKPGLNNRTVNALTSQRLTDQAAGSTFYDTKVDVRAWGQA